MGLFSFGDLILKVAICLRGAIAKVTGSFSGPGSLYAPGEYVNYKAVHASIMKHIVQANIGCVFDFYLQSWNPDLVWELSNLYHPQAARFEHNESFDKQIQSKVVGDDDYRGISQALAIKRSFELCKFSNYDLVISYRPDVLLWKDMVLKNINPSVVTVNAHPDGQGDFHFIMGPELAAKFGGVFDSTDWNPHRPHFWIKNFIEQGMKASVVMDDILPGLHQEVLRKIHAISHKTHNVPLETFTQFGLTLEEIQKYNLP